MGVTVLVIAAIAAVIALIATACARRAALSLGYVDRPGERKIHSHTVPYGGGLAVAAALAIVLGSTILYDRYQDLVPDISGDPSPRTLIFVFGGALGALLLGFFDDIYKFAPWTKLAATLLLAAGTVAGGVRITALIGDNLLMQCATVLWITLITHSFNLLDNMDGLCAGVVAITSALLIFVTLPSEQYMLSVILAALSGSSLGFLWFNRAPASIFLGDAGSLFCGYLLACFTVLVTYYHQISADVQSRSHLAIGIPLLILAIPLYDTFSVFMIRLKERRPLMRGDTSHFSHRLVDLGMSRRQAVATIHLACLAIGIPATILEGLSETAGLLIIAQGLLVLTIVALLESAGRKRALRRGAEHPPQRREDAEA